MICPYKFYYMQITDWNNLYCNIILLVKDTSVMLSNQAKNQTDHEREGEYGGVVNLSSEYCLINNYQYLCS